MGEEARERKGVREMGERESGGNLLDVVIYIFRLMSSRYLWGKGWKVCYLSEMLLLLFFFVLFSYLPIL